MATTFKQACETLTAILGYEVVPARNIHVLDKDALSADFFRMIKRYGSASYFNKETKKLTVFIESPGEDPLTRVAQLSAYAIVSALGPAALLPTERHVRDFNGKTGVERTPEEAREALLACSDYSGENLIMMTQALRAAGLPCDDTVLRSAINGMRHYYGERLSEAVQARDYAALASLATVACRGQEEGRIHMGASSPMWLDMGYPALDLSVKKKAFLDMLGDAGFTPEDIVEKDLIRHVNEPMAMLKEKNGGYKAVLPVVDADGEFLTYSIHSPEQMAEFDAVTMLSIRGFGHIHPDALLKRLAWKSPEDNTVIAYLRKKEGTMHSYVISDVLRDIRNGKDKKATPALRRVEAQDATDGGLKYDANIETSGETSKNNLTFSDKKATPALRRVEAQDATDGGLKLDANISDLEETTKNKDHVFVPLTPAERDFLLERAARNVEAHKNDHSLDAVDAAIAEAVQAAEAPQGDAVSEDPMDRALPADAFSFGIRAKLADEGIRDAGALSAAMTSLHENGFTERFGAKAWASSVAFMTSLGLMTPKMLRPLPLDVASVMDFGAERLRNLRESLRALPRNLAQGVVQVPRAADATVFPGSDMHYLLARLATTPDWKGCPIFIAASQLPAYGLSPADGAEPALSATAGEAVYNLMDTDMSPLLKEEVLLRAKAGAKAVPASIVTQAISVSTMTEDIAAQAVSHLDRTWDGMSTLRRGDTCGASLEDILMKARHNVERMIDPRKALQKYGFPEAVVTELIDKGDVCYKGPILTRPDNGISTPQQRIVNIRLRILDGEARLCTPAGNPVGNSLINALKDVKLDAATLGRVDRFFAERKAAVQAPEKSRGRRPGE